MKKSKFTKAQIVFSIKQFEQGVKVEEICRKIGISEATLYNWKKKYGGLGVSELRELLQLNDKNVWTCEAKGQGAVNQVRTVWKN